MKQNTTNQTTAPGAEIITADNVQHIAERVAVKALKTCLTAGKGKPLADAIADGNKTGNFDFMHRMYAGLIGDITERKHTLEPFSDGYDVAQVASAFLCEHIGENLHAPAKNGETTKDGKPVDILRACFRAVNRYIMGERKREYLRAYVDETDENGNNLYYEIPDEWDIPTVTDFHAVNEMITALKLSANEKRFIVYRMRGLSLEMIAKTMNLARGTINKYRMRIKEKARNVPALAPYCE